MKRLLTILLLFLTISGAAQKKTVPLPAFLPETLELEDKPLYALKRISVNVKVADMPKAKPLVDESAVRVAIELALRKAGFIVVTPVDTDLPTLFFMVEAIPNDLVPLYAYRVKLSLVDLASVTRSKQEPKGYRLIKISSFVSIWEEGEFGTVGFQRVKLAVEESARKLTDAFLNDWLAQNQK